MATISSHPVGLTIPAAYLEDVRTALVAEINSDSEAIRTDQKAVLEGSSVGSEDRGAAVRILREDMQLLDQALSASGETTVVTGERAALVHALDAMVRVLSARLVYQCEYAPVEMAAVAELADRLRWSAEQAAAIGGC